MDTAGDARLAFVDRGGLRSGASFQFLNFMRLEWVNTIARGSRWGLRRGRAKINQVLCFWSRLLNRLLRVFFNPYGDDRIRRWQNVLEMVLHRVDVLHDPVEVSVDPVRGVGRGWETWRQMSKPENQ